MLLLGAAEKEHVNHDATPRRLIDAAFGCGVTMEGKAGVIFSILAAAVVVFVSSAAPPIVALMKA